jgi:hypothetical protein
MSFQTFRIGQLFVIKITAQSGYSLPNIMGHDAVIIESNDGNFIRSVVISIRRHHQPEVYLKPIFIQNFTPKKNSILHGLIDGFIFGEDDIKGIEEKAKNIFIRSLDLHPHVPAGDYSVVIKKAMDLMYTRQVRTLKPILDPYSIIGYSFPQISVSFEQHEEPEVLNALDWAEMEGLIWPDFEEKIYLCNNCAGGLLSFREVCPHCKSSNTYGEDLVHHFPCAYIGPISDFQNNVSDTLTCPKCNKSLHHIGVDYDKPSVLNHCNTCDSRFQDIYVKAKCLNCENDTDVQYLQARDINTYKLTKKGRQSILQGMELSNHPNKIEITDIQSEDTFETLLQFDILREQQDRVLLCGLNIENLNDFATHFGGFKKQSIIKEIAQVLKGEISPLDYLTLNSTGLFIWTRRIEKNDNSEEKTPYDIVERIQQLVNENFDQFKMKIKFLEKDLTELTSAHEGVLDMKRQLLNE